MTVPILRGDRLILRTPQEPDRSARQGLGLSADIQLGFGSLVSARPTLTDQEAARWYRDVASTPYLWIIQVGSRFAGTIRLHSLVEADRRASMAIAILAPDLLEQGYGTEAIQLLVGHAFRTMELHRIGIRVLASNARAIRCYEKCGFRLEGRERQSARIGDRWEDDLIMGLVADGR
ncbi:MAG: GNAT family protein [Tepidiformaceae bacterium]